MINKVDIIKGIFLFIAYIIAIKIGDIKNYGERRVYKMQKRG